MSGRVGIQTMKADFAVWTALFFGVKKIHTFDDTDLSQQITTDTGLCFLPMITLLILKEIDNYFFCNFSCPHGQIPESCERWYGLKTCLVWRLLTWVQISISFYRTLMSSDFHEFFFPSVTYYFLRSDRELVKSLTTFFFENYVKIMVRMIEEVRALNNMDTIKRKKLLFN